MHSDANLLLLLLTAMTTGFLHTIAGPDHYLPFIAIARSRHYGLGKTLLWTFLCGIGHVGSALLLAAVFLLFSKFFSRAQLDGFEQIRGSIAAAALVGMGAAVLCHALYSRWKKRPHRHRHVHVDGSITIHRHDMFSDHARENEKNFSYWVVFIIFVLGPCEALLPLLTASAVLGTSCVILTASVFSAATIATMLCAVAFGTLGVHALHIHCLEHYASEIAGGTVMACGLAILCLGL